MESSRRGCVVEIKVLSCKDLKAFNFFQKLSVYAVVSLQLVERQMNRTPTDGEGNGNPEWNHQMRFEFAFELKDWDGLFFHFDLRHEGVGLLGIGDRSIGEVRVPLKDLILNLNNNNNIRVLEDDHDSEIVLVQQQQQQEARYVNYQVTTTDGKANGTFNFSYKLIKLYNVKGTGPTYTGANDDHDQPRPYIQYPTITVSQEDDGVGGIRARIAPAAPTTSSSSSTSTINTTQVCYPATSAGQSQTSLHESFSQLVQQECSSSTAAASSAAPPLNSSSQSEISQLQAADHHPICCWLPQYHHNYHYNYHPPLPVLSAADHAYYPPPPLPPPPPPPPPMADHRASNHVPNYFLPPPPGHGMVRPWPSHPNYHDCCPWSPANIGPRRPRQPPGHGF